MLSSNYSDHLYPCNLRIKLTPEISESLIENLTKFIHLAFDSFFYNIIVSNWSIDPNNIIDFGREEFKRDNMQSKETVLVFPTDLFYKFLKKMQSHHFLSAVDLGITHLPIYSSNKKNLIFLYGEAHINRKCALVSTYKLCDANSIIAKEQSIIDKRIIKECIHEIGHLILGIKHCINSNCVMNYSTNLKKVDKKSIFPCNSCFEKLEGIRENYNF